MFNKFLVIDVCALEKRWKMHVLVAVLDMTKSGVAYIIVLWLAVSRSY